MRFIRTTKGGTDAFRQVASRQQAIEFHDGALGMHPCRFNRVEPGALGGQQDGQDPHAFARLLALSIGRSYPGPHRLALVPGGVIPDQEPMRLALLEQLLTAPLQELGGDRADRTPSHQAQPGSLSGPGLRACPAATGRQSRPAPWGPGRSCATRAPPTLRGGPDFARRAPEAERSGSTRPHHHSQSPSWAVGWPRRSNGLVRFFYQGVGIGAGDPVFGALPVGTQAFEGTAHALVGHQAGDDVLLDADLGGQVQGP
jgi:hypothetical protein